MRYLDSVPKLGAERVRKIHNRITYTITLMIRTR
jgi:hypothetical protein